MIQIQSLSPEKARYWSLWAKTDRKNPDTYYSLFLHLLDVAICAEEILAREPESTRDRMGEILGMSWEKAGPWLLLCIALHDSGKASPCFQKKWQKSTELLQKIGLYIPPGCNEKENHAFVSNIYIAEYLQSLGWPQTIAAQIASTGGVHHGSHASVQKLANLKGDRRVVGDPAWRAVRKELFDALFCIFSPGDVPQKEQLNGPDFMLLAGLTSFADWIGSNEAKFKFATPEEYLASSGWYEERRQIAKESLDAIGWYARTPLCAAQKSFKEVFTDLEPRPLQLAMEKISLSIQQPSVILIEAPMGEGKTEASFYAHLVLQRRFGHRGLYVALPTKATGNAMFTRTLAFLKTFSSERTIDLQLVHGATLLNDSFQILQSNDSHYGDEEFRVQAGEWFTNKKRALLSEYSVGTIDQALLTIFPVRHNFVRLWGLANRVVIFDEIHAYDAYTGTLLLMLITWLLALGSSVILLSATVPPLIREQLGTIVGASMPDTEVPYPRISVFSQEKIEQDPFGADPSRRQRIELIVIAPEASVLRATMEGTLRNGGMGLILVNTVQRAQDVYAEFPSGQRILHNGCTIGKKLSDGMCIYLFHARFPSDRRQIREEYIQALFGKTGDRTGCAILIATQVCEQSLDLDFDVMISDLAPIDLLLQRAGRLWRHAREPGVRHDIKAPCLFVAGLAGDVPPSFDAPLYWSSIYYPDILLSTWELLRNRTHIVLPDEIDDLVQKVYTQNVEISDGLKEVYKKNVDAGTGEILAYKNCAMMAVIEDPDDISWDDPDRYMKNDEDFGPLAVKTRMGEESISAIPIMSDEAFSPTKTPSLEHAKKLYARSVSITRKKIVRLLQIEGIPEGWKKSPLLRSCIPLCLDAEYRWRRYSGLRLDEELGIVFENKEE